MLPRLVSLRLPMIPVRARAGNAFRPGDLLITPICFFMNATVADIREFALSNPSGFLSSLLKHLHEAKGREVFGIPQGHILQVRVGAGGAHFPSLFLSDVASLVSPRS